jgi:hypothetical protein
MQVFTACMLSTKQQAFSHLLMRKNAFLAPQPIYLLTVDQIDDIYAFYIHHIEIHDRKDERGNTIQEKTIAPFHYCHNFTKQELIDFLETHEFSDKTWLPTEDEIQLIDD